MRSHLLLAYSLFVFSLPGVAAPLFVSPGGSDSATGAMEHPLATLERARDLVREQRKDPKEPAEIVLLNGTYELPAPVELGAKDVNLVIHAAAGAAPWLTAARAVRNWTPHTGAVLKSQVSALVPKGRPVKQLLVDGARQTLARYPNADAADPRYSGWAWVDDAPKGVPDDHDLKREFFVRPADVRKWAHPEKVEVVMWKLHGWFNDQDHVSGFDPAARRIRLDRKPGEGYDIVLTNRYFFQNALEELDSPGEWFYDSEAGTLYFWPPAPLAGRDVRVVTGDGMIRVTKGARQITIRGLRFGGCDGAAVNFDQCDDCRLEECQVDGVGSGGSYAVTINQGHNNHVSRCEIAHCGGGGIRLFGGEVKPLKPAGHVAEDNEIHETGLDRTSTSGIWMGGVGCSAVRNHIHDVPRLGIEFQGMRMLIEYNHVHHAMLEALDGAGIYSLGRNWLNSRGSSVRYNFVHDTLGVAPQANNTLKLGAYAWSIYMDDTTAGVDIVGNICARASRGSLHMHDARDCIVENNVFIDGGEWQLDLQGWKFGERFGGTNLEEMEKGYAQVANEPAWRGLRGIEIDPQKAGMPDGTVMSGNVLRRNIIAWHNPKVRYFWAVNVSPKANLVERNLIWCGGEPQNTFLQKPPSGTGTPWQNWQAAGWDAGSVIADPFFVREKSDDFRLRKDSPAWALGWQEIPVGQIGPRPRK